MNKRKALRKSVVARMRIRTDVVRLALRYLSPLLFKGIGLPKRTKGGNWKSDKSCTSNPKSENANWTGDVAEGTVQSEVSDFGFEVQDSFNFRFSCSLSAWAFRYVKALFKEGNKNY